MDLGAFIKDTSNVIGNRLNPNGNLGLIDGCMGNILTVFVISRFDDDPRWKQMGALLLKNINQRISTVDQYGYSKGLAGIGWGIEWVKQKGFVSVNTDSVLEEVDDVLYKLTMFSHDQSNGLFNGVVGKGAYFLKRYQSVNSGTPRYKTICLEECLILITDEIQEKSAGIIKDFSENDIPAESQLIDLCDIIIFLSKIIPHKINITTVEDTLYYFQEHLGRLIINFIRSFPSKLTVTHKSAFLRLAYAYGFMGDSLKCKCWSTDGLKYCDIIQSKLNSLELIESSPILSRLFAVTHDKKYLNRLVEIATINQSLKIEVPSLKNRLIITLLSSIGSITKDCSWDEVLLYS